MRTLWQDARFALRTLRKSPGFAAIVIATLALGVGINTAMFSVANTVLWSSLPYARPERLSGRERAPSVTCIARNSTPTRWSFVGATKWTTSLLCSYLKNIYLVGIALGRSGCQKVILRPNSTCRPVVAAFWRNASPNVDW
jgi:hypothetical protein